MKKLGVNAVRVPFGYWAFAPKAGEPFVGNCLEFLDATLEWGAELGMSIVLCLHAAVGFQSAEPPCGRADENWRPCKFDVAATVDVMRQVVRRYGQHGALGGICILNEPAGNMPDRTLRRYFAEAYSAMRGECGLPPSVQVMMPIFHNDFKHFRGIFTEEQGYANVVFDVHCYQVFGGSYAGWSRMTLAEHLRYATAQTSKHDARCIADHGERVVVSEFSVALPVWGRNWLGKVHAALSESEKAQLRRCFALRQLRTFATYTEGFFFWCWRDDSGPEWSFSDATAKGWFPPLCGEAQIPQSSDECVANRKTAEVSSSEECWETPEKRRRLVEPCGISTPPAVICNAYCQDVFSDEAAEGGDWSRPCLSTLKPRSHSDALSEASTDSGGPSGDESTGDLRTDEKKAEVCFDFLAVF